MDGRFPKWLQFGERLLAEMTGIAPAVGQLVQCAREGLPLMRLGARFVALGPGLDLLDQRQPLRLVRGGFCLELFEPGFHHLVGFVAGFIETFPQRMVGCAALVHCLPLFAQLAKGFLHLAPTHHRHRRVAIGVGFFGCARRIGRGRRSDSAFAGGRCAVRETGFGRASLGHNAFGRRRNGLHRLGGWPLGRSCGFQLDFGLALQQGLGLDHQFFAQLVRAPALPAFKFPGGAQRGMHPGFKRSVQIPAMLLERIAQRSRGTGTGFAMAFTDFLLHFFEHRRHRCGGVLALFLTHRGIHLRLGWLGGNLRRQAACGAQLLGPHRHRRQRRGGVGLCGNGLRQGSAEGVPDHQQLGAR